MGVAVPLLLALFALDDEQLEGPVDIAEQHDDVDEADDWLEEEHDVREQQLEDTLDAGLKRLGSVPPTL